MASPDRASPSAVASGLLRMGALTAVLLWFVEPQAAAQGAHHALALWWQSLVPALFPFLAAGELYLWGTQGQSIRRDPPRAVRLLERLLGLSWSALPALLAGLIGGYPLGAALADRWVARGVIPEREGARLTALASAPDPLFVAALWAPALSHAPLLGPVLLGIQYFALLPALLVLRFVERRRETRRRNRPSAGSGTILTDPRNRRRLPPASDPLLHGALSAARSLVVLATVLTCLGATAAALSQVAPFLGLRALSPLLHDMARAFADGLFVAEERARLPLPWMIALTSSLASFGGLAVWAETWALTRRTRMDLGPFAIARVVQALGSGVLAFWVTQSVWRHLVPGIPVLAPPVAMVSPWRLPIACAAGLFGWLLVTRPRMTPRRSGDAGTAPPALP